MTAELLPVILTAALMIAGATLTLLISGVHFLAAFGPAMAIAVVVAAAVALTLVPAALAIFGRALLWPRGPRAERRRAGRRRPASAGRARAAGRRRRPLPGPDRRSSACVDPRRRRERASASSRSATR